MSEGRPPAGAERASCDSYGFEPDSLARYDSLVHRIAELEREKVEHNLRQAEAKLKGLLQTLHSYEGTLHELHRLSNERKLLTIKAMGSFDLLGKKHKDKKVEASRKKEVQTTKDETAQMEKICKLTRDVHDQRMTVIAWRRKARELDYVRQCEADLVDRVFRGQDAENEQHDALEEAVCSLAPKIMAMRESCANFAVLKSRCETAAVQQREAASNLQRAFHPPDQALRDVYGEGTQDHEQLDASDHRARLSAVTTAAKLLKLSVLNLRAAQPGLMLHLLEEEEISSLEQVLQPLTDICLTSPAAESLADNAVKLITHRELQSRRAAQELDTQANNKNREMLQVEERMLEYKFRLDDHRRDLLSERLPSLGPCQSELVASAGPCVVYTEEEFDNYTRKHPTNSSSTLSSMGEKVSSISSDLNRMGSTLHN